MKNTRTRSLRCHTRCRSTFRSICQRKSGSPVYRTSKLQKNSNSKKKLFGKSAASPNATSILSTNSRRRSASRKKRAVNTRSKACQPSLKNTLKNRKVRQTIKRKLAHIVLGSNCQQCSRTIKKPCVSRVFGELLRCLLQCNLSHKVFTSDSAHTRIVFPGVLDARIRLFFTPLSHESLVTCLAGRQIECICEIG